MVFRRGDIVWARVKFPTKWWPALVRSINGHRVAVSFFDDGEYSRFFYETEVCSFAENFDVLVKTIKKSSRGEELLDSSLRLLARRAAYNLRCPCHFRPLFPGGRIVCRRRKRDELFQPDALLSFVLGLAVSPFVRDSDFVGAVTTASQLNVFRRYLVVERKLRHPKTTGADFVAQSSDASMAGFVRADCWDQPENGSRIYVNDANTETDSLDGMQLNMNFLASDDNHSSEVELYQPSVEVNGKAKTCSDTSNPPKSYLSKPTVWGLKRRYVQSVGSYFRFKFCKTMPLSHSIQVEHTTSIDSHKVPTESSTQDSINGAFSSIERSVGNKSLLPLVTSDATSYMLQEAHESENDTLIGHSTDSHKISVETSGLESTDTAAEKTSQVAQQSACVVEVEHNTSIDNGKHSINGASSFGVSCMENKLLLPLVTSDAPSSTPQEAPKSTNASIRMDHSRDNHNISAKACIYERINALFYLKESTTENNSQAAHTTKMEHTTCIDSKKVSVKNCRQDSIKATFSSKGGWIDSTGNKLLLPLGTLDKPSAMPNEVRESTNASTQMNHMDHSRNKKIDAAFSFKEIPTKKSKVNKQSAHTVYGSCQKLYMKFPRDFNLPSKKDLIKKFRRFGLIDLVRTKVFERMGSAQVVFLHHFDAVTAYQYAKLKKCLFHGAHVLYWLDQYEQARSHTRFSAPLPKLKSCLKNPYSCRQEDKKPSRKVRFLMQS